MNTKSLLLSLFFFTTFFALQAQTTLKIGHVNVQELVQKHPDMDSIQTVLKQESDEMQEIYDEMLAEHEKKLAAFEAESAGYSDFAKKAKQTDLMELAQKIQAYNQSAQQQIQQRNRELIQPVYQEINQEIANIAGYDKFTYILDVSNGAVAYISPESLDITAQVLEALLE